MCFCCLQEVSSITNDNVTLSVAAGAVRSLEGLVDMNRFRNKQNMANIGELYWNYWYLHGFGPILNKKIDFLVFGWIWGVPLDRYGRWHPWGWVEMSGLLIETQICWFFSKPAPRRCWRTTLTGGFFFKQKHVPFQKNTHIAFLGKKYEKTN